jgi:hypothetical protein
MTSEDWTKFVEANYSLIYSEFAESSTAPQTLSQKLPKLIIACEYFRLLRGEAFHSQRPADLKFNNGKTAYQMEDELFLLLREMIQQCDLTDPSLKYHLEEMAKIFNDIK